MPENRRSNRLSFGVWKIEYVGFTINRILLSSQACHPMSLTVRLQECDVRQSDVLDLPTPLFVYDWLTCIERCLEASDVVSRYFLAQTHQVPFSMK